SRTAWAGQFLNALKGMRTMKFDFKYTIALFVSIVGASVSIWYANVPATEKSLSLTILSQSLLNVAGESEIEGLKITIDEKEIAEPALIVLKVENDGIIPIRSDDFESDLEIILEGDINLIRASVIQTRPEWIKPSIL